MSARHRTRGIGAVLLCLVMVAAGCTVTAKDDTPGPTAGEAAITDLEARPVQSPGQSLPDPRFGAKWDWGKVDAHAGLITRLGPGVTFYELEWCGVEPLPGGRDWSTTDAVVERAAQLGTPLSLKLRVGSCWATGGPRGEARGVRGRTPSAMPDDLAAYGAFITEAVQRYRARGVETFALENEVNAPIFWHGSVEELVELVRFGAAAVRAADPTARLADTGLSSTAYGVAMAEHLLDSGRPGEAVRVYRSYYARRTPSRRSEFPEIFDEGQLRAALQLPQARRNIAHVEAAFSLAAAGMFDAYQLHFYEHWSNVAPLLRFLREGLPPQLPIEGWEIGIFWPDADPGEERLAAETTQLVGSLLREGVSPIVFLPLSYNPQGRSAEIRWGLAEPHGETRPAGELLTALAAAVQQGGSCHPLDAGGVVGVACGTARETLVLVWGDGVLLPPSGTVWQAAMPTGAPLHWPEDGLVVDGRPLVVTAVGVSPPEVAEELGTLPSS